MFTPWLCSCTSVESFGRTILALAGGVVCGGESGIVIGVVGLAAVAVVAVAVALAYLGFRCCHCGGLAYAGGCGIIGLGGAAM